MPRPKSNWRKPKQPPVPRTPPSTIMMACTTPCKPNVKNGPKVRPFPSFPPSLPSRSYWSFSFFHLLTLPPSRPPSHTALNEAAQEEKKSSKYIDSLKRAAELKKQEQDQFYERRLAKERKEEDELYKDKEVFGTYLRSEGRKEGGKRRRGYFVFLCSMLKRFFSPHHLIYALSLPPSFLQ